MMLEICKDQKKDEDAAITLSRLLFASSMSFAVVLVLRTMFEAAVGSGTDMADVEFLLLPDLLSLPG